MIQQSQGQSLGENYSRTEAKKQRTDGHMTSIARRYSRGEATVATRNSELQRAGSSMVARTQGTDKEMVAGSLPQSHEEVGKREVAVIPQNLLVDQSYKRHCSDTSIKAKKPRLNKSIYLGEYLQPLAQSRGKLPREAVSTETINVGTSDAQQFEIEKCNQTTVVNGSDIGESGVDQGEAVASGSVNVVTSEHQDFSQGQLVGLDEESGQVDDTPMSRSLLHENRRIQADKSTRTAVMTDVGIDAVRDSEPATCSNYARTSGLEHRKTEMWKKFKFSIRHLKGHTDFVCGVDCRNSVLASGG